MSIQDYDKKLVLQQLRHLGVLETCKIRRQGYPVRRSFQSIAEEYACLCNVKDANAASTSYDIDDDTIATALDIVTVAPVRRDSSTASVDFAMRTICQSILETHAVVVTPPTPPSTNSTESESESTSNDWHIGITKVFLRDGVLEILNEAKNQWHLKRANAAAKIQSIVRIQAKERHANGAL